MIRHDWTCTSNRYRTQCHVNQLRWPLTLCYFSQCTSMDVITCGTVIHAYGKGGHWVGQRWNHRGDSIQKSKAKRYTTLMLKLFFWLRKMIPLMGFLAFPIIPSEPDVFFFVKAQWRHACRHLLAQVWLWAACCFGSVVIWIIWTIALHKSQQHDHSECLSQDIIVVNATNKTTNIMNHYPGWFTPPKSREKHRV